MDQIPYHLRENYGGKSEVAGCHWMAKSIPVDCYASKRRTMPQTMALIQTLSNSHILLMVNKCRSLQVTTDAPNTTWGRANKEYVACQRLHMPNWASIKCNCCLLYLFISAPLETLEHPDPWFPSAHWPQNRHLLVCDLNTDRGANESTESWMFTEHQCYFFF